MIDLDALFGTDGHLAWWQECARAVVVFAYGLAVVRVAGRRVFGRWAALDIVVAIVVGSNLSRTLTGSAPLLGTLAATTLLMALHRVLARAAARSPRASKLVEGPAVELARDGRPEPSTLVREAISQGDLGETLRQAGVERAAETRLITLEPSGKITVLKVR